MTQTAWKRALLLYGVASLTLILGVTAATVQFPGGFDWVYTVISRLGSRTHNPDGAPWLLGSLLAAVALLWPVTNILNDAHARPRVAITALRIGLIGGALLAVEGLFMLDLSVITRKGHEIVALATFLGLYTGVLGLYLHRIRNYTASLLPALLVILPLCAVGFSQLALYFDQRDLGWVDTAWREMGVPFWLSFAFWQWMAVAFLGMGLGYLVTIRNVVAPRTEGAHGA